MEEKQEKDSAEKKEKKKTNRNKRAYTSEKPWWLVVFLVLVLIYFGVYINWLNSPKAALYQSFGDYLFGHQITEPIPDFRTALDTINHRGPEQTWPEEQIASSDTLTDSWGDVQVETPAADTSFSLGPVQDESKTTFPEAKPIVSPEPFSTSSSPENTRYYIKAGEFATKNGALNRIRELSQGNYPARLIEPVTQGGKYSVVVGEYASYSKAKELSNSINFILEIRTSVEKME